MAIKIAGREVEKKLNEDLLILPRCGESIVIRARALPDLDEFMEMCPDPKPPGKRTKDGFVPNTDDDTYKKRLEQHNLQRIGYMTVKSLEPSEITWERVDLEKPNTWTEWEGELKESGFTTVECNLILGLIMEVNSLNEAALKEARLFLTWSGAGAKRILFPKYRTGRFAIWRACERLGVTPPGLPKQPGVTHWDYLASYQQADVLAYDQVCQHDEADWDARLAGAGMPKGKPQISSRKSRKR